jgi:hypothetical protein
MIFVALESADDRRKSGKFKCTTNSHMHDELMSMSSKDFYDLLNKRDVRRLRWVFHVMGAILSDLEEQKSKSLRRLSFDHLVDQ